MEGYESSQGLEYHSTSIAAGSMSAMAAPVFFSYLPTEWSSFSNIVVGTIRAFATAGSSYCRENIWSSFERRVKGFLGSVDFPLSTAYRHLILAFPLQFSSSRQESEDQREEIGDVSLPEYLGFEVGP